ncbi:MAG: TIGR04255 family protein [Candidatus Nitrotoga sp.]|nr:TIGR04255 family protein [Candidatus Nitrotoga sp.]
MDYPFPSYKSPPLSEVSIGLQFQPLERLKIPHFGLFWNLIRKDFPVVEHASPILAQSETFNAMPLPRVWFIGKSDAILLQLQSDRINFNWRFREGADPYPHYDTIAHKFFELFNIFDQFIAEAGIGVILPTVAEATYINQFEQGKEWKTMEDIGAVFKDFAWSQETARFLPHPTNLSWAASFALPNQQGTLNARMNQGLRVSDQQQIMQLEIAASYQVQNMPFPDLRPWYELAHEWIVKGFADLTQPGAQKNFWGREK